MFNLYIDNYRSFKEQTFNFSRINVLIGENNSGKSSILKFFLALKQSIEVANKQNISFSDFYTDLGNYEDVIYYHDQNKRLEFSFQFNDKYKEFFEKFMIIDLGKDEKAESSRKRTKQFIDNLKDYNSLVKVNIGKNTKSQNDVFLEFSNKELGTIKVNSLIDEIDPSLTYFPYCRFDYKNNDFKFFSDKITYEEKSFMRLVRPSSLIEEIINNNIDMNIFHNFAYLLIQQNYIDYLTRLMSYFNPLESIPQRFYYKKDLASVTTKNDLNKYVNILSSDEFTQNEFDSFFTRISEIVKDFGIADQVDLVMDNRMPISELRVKIKNLISNIKDVGYGVSLQMPLLFELLQNHNKAEQIYLIEQPEVHLFPKLQAKFIETLLKYSNPNDTIFIETHSEHILRKLQVLIKEKQYNLKPSDVSIHYLSRSEEKSIVTEHKVLENGKLTPIFPKGFYDSSYSLAKQLLD